MITENSLVLYTTQMLIDRVVLQLLVFLVASLGCSQVNRNDLRQEHIILLLDLQNLHHLYYLHTFNYTISPICTGLISPIIFRIPDLEVRPDRTIIAV